MVQFITTRTSKRVILVLTFKDFVANFEAVGAHGHVGEHKTQQESLVSCLVLPHGTAGDGVLVSTKEKIDEQIRKNRSARYYLEKVGILKYI